MMPRLFLRRFILTISPRFNATIADSFQSLTPWHEEFRVNHPKKGLVWVKGRCLTGTPAGWQRSVAWIS